MGMCNSDYGVAVDVDDRTRRAKVKSISWLAVRTMDEETGVPLSRSSMVATLLHEISHAITDLVLKKGVVKEHGKKSSRKFRPEVRRFWAAFC